MAKIRPVQAPIVCRSVRQGDDPAAEHLVIVEYFHQKGPLRPMVEGVRQLAVHALELIGHVAGQHLVSLRIVP
jgi:hypothetical protein